MRTLSLSIAFVFASALALSGCLGEFAGKKTDDTTAESLAALASAANATATVMEQTAAQSQGPTNASTAAPVARITAFAPSGALIFKSTFQAEDPTAMIMVDENATVRLIAADSEAIAPGATLTSFAWTLNGKMLGVEKQAAAKLEGPGVYVVALTVTDTNGRSDAQKLQLAVMPTPFDVVTNLTSDPVAGAEGEGQLATLTFTLALADAKMPATIEAVTFTARPPVSCDVVLEVVDAKGTVVGKVDQKGAGGAETVEAASLPEGAYTLTLSPQSPCLAPQGMPVSVVVTYLPIIEGLSMDEQHH